MFCCPVFEVSCSEQLGFFELANKSQDETFLGQATGTGDGCESIYGGPYPDEIHPRLKFRLPARVTPVEPRGVERSSAER